MFGASATAESACVDSSAQTAATAVVAAVDMAVAAVEAVGMAAAGMDNEAKEDTLKHQNLSRILLSPRTYLD